MIFQHTWQKVLSGEKTQTRRIVKDIQTVGRIAPGTALEFMPIGTSWDDIVAVRQNGRDIYALSKTYAVQPARCRPAIWISPDGKAQESVEYLWDIEYETIRRDKRGWMKELGWHEARIQITRIRQEDVRDISNEDVRAEGYNHVRDFLHVWCGMHDPSIEHGTWGETKLMSRPANRYRAWVLQFKLVEVK